MRGAARSVGIVVAAAVGLGALSLHSVSAGDDAAGHAIAEKFAREAQKAPRKLPKPKRTPEERKAEEAEMLERARAEAELRRLELERGRTEAEHAERSGGADVQRPAGIERQKEVEAARVAEASEKAEKQRLAAQALERERQRTVEIRRQVEDVARAEAARRAAAARSAEETARMTAEREAEARRIAERLRQAEIARTAAARTSATPFAPRDRSSLGVPVDRAYREPASDTGNRVTVLLILKPGSYGIRRHNKTGDPVICGPSGCYVSEGPAAAAHFQSGRRALGFSGVFGERAGACRNSLGCIFRDVDLVTLSGIVQPVDMHVLKHDRRSPQHVQALSDCRVDAARLQCHDTIDGGDYVMWIVPESVAADAGPERLERALGEGLPPYRRASLEGR